MGEGRRRRFWHAFRHFGALQHAWICKVLSTQATCFEGNSLLSFTSYDVSVLCQMPYIFTKYCFGPTSGSTTKENHGLAMFSYFVNALSGYITQALATTLQPEELSDLRDQFNAMDVDGNGTITLEEIRHVRPDSSSIISTAYFTAYTRCSCLHCRLYLLVLLQGVFQGSSIIGPCWQRGCWLCFV